MEVKEKNKKERVILFVKNHKSEIITSGIAVVAICGYFIEKNNVTNLKLINAQLMNDNTKALKKISNLKEENQLLKTLVFFF